MDGNILPLPEIIDLLASFPDVTLILDSAHATANLGRTGRGILEHFNLSIDNVEQQGIDLIVLSTLSKFAASAGAVISSHSRALYKLMQMSMFYINTTSLSPGLLASATSALQTMMRCPHYVAKLQANTRYARAKLAAQNFKISGETHIIPIFFNKDIQQVQRI